MRIAVWQNQQSGGGKRAGYYHVRGLVERGHHVEAWCPSTADQTYLPFRELVKEHTVPLNFPKIPATGLRRHFALARLIPNRLREMDRHCRLCAEEINQGGFDVLFAHCCTFFRVTSIARHVKLPSVLYLGEPYRWLYEALPQLPWLAPPPSSRRWFSPRRWWEFLNDFGHVYNLRIQAREEVRNAEAFSTILVNSLFSRESVLRAYGLESKVCYLGIDTELFRPTGSPKEKFVVGLGGIYLGKGVERAIRAIGAVPEAIRPPLIWIGNFGGHDYQTEIERLACSLGVLFVPKIRIPDAEVVDLLSRATAMIYTPRLEPFGFAPLEANACGTPVVAIAEGGVRESIHPGLNGLLVDSDDPAALARALVELLEDPEKAERMGTAARRHVMEQWTLASAIDRLEARLHEACEAKEDTRREDDLDGVCLPRSTSAMGATGVRSADSRAS